MRTDFGGVSLPFHFKRRVRNDELHIGILSLNFGHGVFGFLEFHHVMESDAGAFAGSYGKSEKADIVASVGAVLRLAGFEVVQGDGYPGWKPNMKSAVLAVTRKQYKKAFGADAELLAIHAGLECGLLTEKYPDLDIVSFGPNIKGAHSPDERCQITSVQKIWKLFAAVVEKLAK